MILGGKTILGDKIVWEAKLFKGKNTLVQNESRWKMILENVWFSTWGEKITWWGNLWSPKHANVLQQKGDN